MQQHVIDALIVIWSSTHDFLYLGLWIAWEKIFGRKRLDKAIKKSVEERLGQLEALHRKELENERGKQTQTVSSTGKSSD